MEHPRHHFRWLPMFGLMFLSALFMRMRLCGGAAAEEEPLTVRLVVMTTFEPESRPWIHNFGWASKMPFPAGACRPQQPLLWNSTLRVLHCCTGLGPVQAAATVTALGYDRRFDFTRSTWLLSGIGGMDPSVGSIPSANWVRAILDGDNLNYFDPQEKAFPRGWATGWFPQDTWSLATPPYQYSSDLPAPYEPEPAPEAGVQTNVFMLNENLIAFAMAESQNVSFEQTSCLQALRAGYSERFPATAAEPRVISMTSVSTHRFWAGDVSLNWARNWTKYWLHGKSQFATSAEEDMGVATALSGLSRAGHVQHPNIALLVLRVGSNYVAPPAEHDLLSWFASPDHLCVDEAVDAAYKTGNLFIQGLVASWSTDNSINEHEGKRSGLSTILHFLSKPPRFPSVPPFSCAALVLAAFFSGLASAPIVWHMVGRARAVQRSDAYLRL